MFFSILQLTGEKVTRDLQGPLALILEPTRELAIQVMKHLNAAAKHLQIKVIHFFILGFWLDGLNFQQGRMLNV